MRLLFLGDLVGNAGRDAVIASAARLRQELRLDYIVVNGENVSGGRGMGSGENFKLKDMAA